MSLEGQIVIVTGVTDRACIGEAQEADFHRPMAVNALCAKFLSDTLQPTVQT